MHRGLRLWGCVLLALAAVAGCAKTSGGGFTRTIWASAEQVGGNRFRVNSPDTAAGRFKDRPEAQCDGLMSIAVDDELDRVAGASLYLELWGGHPGVAAKRVTLNGRKEMLLPEVGAAAHHCVYSYPEVPLPLTDLTRGANRFQFACEKGETFWGHYLIRAAAVKLSLDDDHPMIAAAGLAGFNATVVAEPVADAETVELGLRVPAVWAGKIASVRYEGRYDGYDDNGDGRAFDWHGYTKDGRLQAVVAVADTAPFAASWDTSMIPDQPGGRLAVRAVVSFVDEPELTFRTPVAECSMPARPASVMLYGVRELPTPFWSRAGRAKTAVIDVPVDPATIERAELRVLIWDGGAGGAADHFTLNGRALPIAGQGRHDVLYRVVPIDPSLLHRGANEIILRSDTAHHGIEVIRPGPALILRTAGTLSLGCIGGLCPVR